MGRVDGKRKAEHWNVTMKLLTEHDGYVTVSFRTMRTGADMARTMLGRSTKGSDTSGFISFGKFAIRYESVDDVKITPET